MQKPKHGIALKTCVTQIQTYLIGKTLLNAHAAAFKIVWQILAQQRPQIGTIIFAFMSARLLHAPLIQPSLISLRPPLNVRAAAQVKQTQ
jgi:hypothetical protein